MKIICLPSLVMTASIGVLGLCFYLKGKNKIIFFSNFCLPETKSNVNMQNLKFFLLFQNLYRKALKFIFLWKLSIAAGLLNIYIKNSNNLIGLSLKVVL